MYASGSGPWAMAVFSISCVEGSVSAVRKLG